jgi:hypothetical protein
VNVSEAVQNMVVEELEWGRFFERCCEWGMYRLRAEAQYQFRNELRERGHRFSSVDLEDAMFDLARELCPDTPAAADDVFDEWAAEIIRKAVRWFKANGVEGSFDSHFEILSTRLLERKRIEFRHAAREWAGAQR